MTPDALDDRPAAPLVDRPAAPPNDRSVPTSGDQPAPTVDDRATAPLAKDGRTVSSASAWRVRSARPTDVPRIHALVRELARYEREPDAVKATPEDFGAALFSPSPRVHCHVVEVDGPDGPTVVGLAIWFVSFSTWRGRHGLWLEDLFVQPAYRGLGAGRALLTELATICADRGYARMEWAVLDWNEPAQHFYRGVGADPQEDWTVWRITDESLKALGNRPR
jgi:GNAT superfamily N-acetyltransferase